MSQDNLFNPSGDPDSTRPAPMVEPAIDPDSTVSVAVPFFASGGALKPVATSTAQRDSDDDSTQFAASVQTEFTQVVAPALAPANRAVAQPVAHDPQATTSDATTTQSVSVSVSRSRSQTTYGSYATRGQSQLRKLAEEAAALQSAPIPHYVGPSSSTSLPPGFGLFEYRIDKVLGQGSFGITYLATDVNLNVQVAIKEYLPSHCAARSGDYSVVVRWPEAEEFYLDGLEAFLMEARTLATFHHPNIVGVARFFEAYQTAYMVLDYEEGQSLKQWWKPTRPAKEPWLVEYLQPLLDGLALVHESGYLHRDIKPDNIYASSDGDRLVLLDFGAARLSVGGEQAVADVLTPGYAPAEQYEGGAQGPWTDIYALGATLYWMVAGKKPDPAPARLSGEAVTPPAVVVGAGRYGTPFLEAIDWALQPEIALRPKTVREFAAALFAEHAGSLNLQDALSAHKSAHRTPTAYKRSSFLGRMWLRLMRLLHPAGWGLTAKLTVLMMIAAMGPLLVTSYYNLQVSSANVTASELKNLEGLAQSTAGRVSQLVADSRTFAKYLATDARFTDYLNNPTDEKRDVLLARLNNLIENNTDVHLAFLMDRDGKTQISSDPDLTGRNFGFREYFQRAIAGEPYSSGMVVGSTAGMPGVYFSNPVRDADGNIVGVMVLRLKGASIYRILNEIKANDGKLVPMMIDSDGMLVAHPDQAKLYGSLQALPEETKQRFIADQRFRRNTFENLEMPDLGAAVTHAKEPGSLGFHSTLSGVDEVAGYAPVSGIGLSIAVSESKSQFQAPLQHLFVNILYTVAGVGVFFVIMVLGLSRSIVRPIKRMIASTEALRNGEFEKAKIEVPKGRHIDEVGQLARTFNIMIDVLRQRERQRDAASSRSLGKARKKKG